jgi:cell division protein FtsW (lipid II flippase)
VAPLLIGLASSLNDPPPRREFIEGIVALAILVVLSGGIIFLPPDLWRWATAVPITALFPLLLWIAARCRPVFAAAVTHWVWLYDHTIQAETVSAICINTCRVRAY